MAQKTYGNMKLDLIGEDDPNFDSNVGKRGMTDVVSPVMNALVLDMLDKDQRIVQMTPGDPFTIAQLRYWQPKGTALVSDQGKRIGVSGGGERNISIEIKELKVSDEDGEDEAPKKVATKKAAKKPVKRTRKATA